VPSGVFCPVCDVPGAGLEPEISDAAMTLSESDLAYDEVHMHEGEADDHDHDQDQDQDHEHEHEHEHDHDLSRYEDGEGDHDERSSEYDEDNAVHVHEHIENEEHQDAPVPPSSSSLRSSSSEQPRQRRGPAEPNQDLLGVLLNLGYSRPLSESALVAVQNSSLDAALSWMHDRNQFHSMIEQDLESHILQQLQQQIGQHFGHIFGNRQHPFLPPLLSRSFPSRARPLLVPLPRLLPLLPLLPQHLLHRPHLHPRLQLYPLLLCCFLPPLLPPHRRRFHLLCVPGLHLPIPAFYPRPHPLLPISTKPRSQRTRAM